MLAWFLKMAEQMLATETLAADSESKIAEGVSR